MKDIRLCFLWHMHQPLYRRSGEHECFAPWVRLHSSRSYYDFARLPDLLPGLRFTVNLVPSLILQIENYVSGSTDSFREVALKPVDQCSTADRVFLFRHFFSVHPERMIAAYPRYQELFRRREEAIQALGEDEAWRIFGSQDYLDLKVLFNLAWFGFAARRDFPDIDRLAARGRDFTEQDCQSIDRIQKWILESIVRLYRKQWEQNQSELSTTPFYHPILPLLLSTDAAREAMPEAPLPAPYGQTADAEEQVRRALEFFRDRFGRVPDGMWPAEGAVSQAAAELLASGGVKWIATDEENLHQSVRSGGLPADICGPWQTGASGREIQIVFRNRDISDRIGFRYADLEPSAAVRDLMGAVERCADASASPAPAVYVILDGENPWEHYLNAGYDFLSELERTIRETPSVTLQTVSESLNAPAWGPHRISHLRAGSWVNGRFSIWIGGPQKNTAWDSLNLTRRELWAGAVSAGNRRAMDSMLAAEGSDWFWWMDGQFATEHRYNFHDLFQKHLETAWEAMSRQPEAGSLERFRMAGGYDERIWIPMARIEGQIDGLQNSYFEWSSAIRFPGQRIQAGSTMAASGGILEALHAGFGRSGELLFRADGFPSAPRQLDIQMSGGPETVSLRFVHEEDGYRIAPGSGRLTGEAVFKRVLEGSLSIPADLLPVDGVFAFRFRFRLGDRETESRWIRMRAPVGLHRLAGWSAV